MSTAVGSISIPFHRACFGEEEVEAISAVIRSGWITMGPKTLAFEQEFARFVGATHAVAVSSGTAALHLALDAIGIKPGDEVLIPTTTFTATGEVVTYFGAKPVLVDVSPDSMNLNCADAARRVTSRTRAIIPVHFAGQPCDMDEIRALAQRYNLSVVEDAAHAIPAEYGKRRIGGISDLTAFSFYATKTLSTGEGGMITTENEHLAARMRMMRLHGIAGDAWKRYGKGGTWYYEVVEAGYKYNLTDLQAALGLVQLGKCDEMMEARRIVATRYTEAFRDNEALETPKIEENRTSSWHLYVLRLHLGRLTIDRDCFVERLKERGIGVSVHFIPLHLQPYYQSAFGYRAGDFPIAEAQFQRCLSLPIYPDLSDTDLQTVVDAVIDIVNDAKR